jgi:hypothetical protein
MSYSSITKKQNINTIVEEDTPETKEQQNIEEYKEQQEILNNKKNKYKKHNEDAYNMTVNMTSSNNVSGTGNENSSMLIIQPRVLNIYNKKYCMRWLTYNINTNYYHYDYCVRLFEIIMKWVRYNNFVIKTNEQVLLGKFMSLMYLLSNKKGYSYDK